MSRRKKNIDYGNPYLNLIAKQGYHIIGHHSGIKPCKWFHEALRGGPLCYKAKFYCIKSHQCMQSTPVLQFCTNACIFCWRVMPERKEDDLPHKGFQWDPPEYIAENLIKEQLKFVQGYKGYEKTPKDRLEEALHPKLATLSLTGEPTIYPYLSELITEFKKRGMYVFLVTNGTLPERLQALKDLPTQLYISMDAPDEETFKKVCRPHLTNAWDKYLQSLDYMRSVKGKTRTVLRMTLIRGHNDNNLEGYAQQIKRAQPDYVEVKSFVYVGGARNPDRGLKLSDMLRMEEIREIAKRLSELTGYIITDEHVLSRVVLLCRDENAVKNRCIENHAENTTNH